MSEECTYNGSTALDGSGWMVAEPNDLVTGNVVEVPD